MAYHVIVNRTMKAIILYVALLIKLLNFLSNSYPPITSSQVTNNFYCRLVGEQKPVTASLSKKGFWLSAFNLDLQCVISNFYALSFMSLNGIVVFVHRTKTNDVT